MPLGYVNVHIEFLRKVQNVWASREMCMQDNGCVFAYQGEKKE